MKFYYVIFSLALAIPRTYAQNTFEKTYGHSMYIEKAFAVKETFDKGFIIAYTDYNDGQNAFADLILLKSDSLGNMIWTKRYGSLTNSLYQAFATSLSITSDSGYIITGGAVDYPGSITTSDVFLLKTDKDGNEQWISTIDSIESQPLFEPNERGNSIIQTTDKGFVITGHAGIGELFILKTDSTGNLEWLSKDSGLGYATAGSVIPVDNNCYLVTGSTSSPNWTTPKVYCVKFDANGNRIWGQTYGWAQGNYAEGWAAALTGEGHYLISGIGRYNGQQYGEMILYKTDTDGVIIWEQNYLVNLYAGALAIGIQDDNHYVFTGYTYHPVTGFNLLLLCTDSTGNRMWDNVYSGWFGYALDVTENKQIVVAGTKNEDIYLLKTAFDGVLGFKDAPVNTGAAVTVYPNPSDGEIRVNIDNENYTEFNIEIFNMLGVKVVSMQSLKAEYINIDTHHLSGLYLIKIFNERGLNYAGTVWIK